MTPTHLRRLLKTAVKSTAWGFACHLTLDEKGDLVELHRQLRSQQQDNPEVMRAVFPKERVYDKLFAKI